MRLAVRTRSRAWRWWRRIEPVVGVSVLPILLGLFIGYFSLQQARVMCWPKTAGVVSTPRYAKASWHNRDRYGSSKFVPGVSRSYVVGGVTYWSTAIGLGFDEPRGFRSENEALQQATTKYPRGTSVEVFYKPDDPWVSVLERRPPKWWVFVGIVSLASLPLLSRLHDMFKFFQRWQRARENRAIIMTKAVTRRVDVL